MAALGHRWSAPLTSAEFLSSLVNATPWWRYRDRAHFLREHASERLPAALVERRDKAEFNSQAFGPLARQFAHDWDGSGVPAGVDVDWLRHHWQTAEHVHAGTALLLQTAWLANR
jgi:hypothetical protein